MHGYQATTRQKYVYKMLKTLTQKVQIFRGSCLNPKLITADVLRSFPREKRLWITMPELFRVQLDSNKRPKVCTFVLKTQSVLIYSEITIES